MLLFLYGLDVTHPCRLGFYCDSSFALLKLKSCNRILSLRTEDLDFVKIFPNPEFLAKKEAPNFRRKVLVIRLFKLDSGPIISSALW